MLSCPAHDGIRHLVMDLNGLLQREHAMHKYEYSWQGFTWLDFSDEHACVYKYRRRADKATPILWVLHHTPVVRNNNRGQ